jgi:Putative DNA-binding domain
MPDLLAQFGSCLIDPDLPPPEGVVGPDGKPSIRRFAVYRNNVVVSLIEALEAAYPAVASLVGSEFFRAMARIFVAQVPPKSPVMLHYGDGFAQFIESFPPAATVPYLADVARLERAWLEAYHAAEAVSGAPEDLFGIPADRFEDVVLDLHPSMRLVPSPHPIVTIWRANTHDGLHEDIDLGRREDALVLRLVADVEVRTLPQAGTAGFLASLLRGRTMAAAALEALRHDPKFDLTANLRDVISVGAVTGWHFDVETEPMEKEGAHVLAES